MQGKAWKDNEDGNNIRYICRAVVSDFNVRIQRVATYSCGTFTSDTSHKATTLQVFKYLLPRSKRHVLLYVSLISVQLS